MSGNEPTIAPTEASLTLVQPTVIPQPTVPTPPAVLAQVTVPTPPTVAPQPAVLPKTKFSVLSLNVALLALTAEIPVLPKIPKKVKRKKIFPGIKIPKTKIKIPAIKTPSVSLPTIPGITKGSPIRLLEVGHLGNNEQRARRIVTTILDTHKYGSAPDIIMIQEAFDTPVVTNTLYKPLQSLYPYAMRDTRAGRVTVGIQKIGRASCRERVYVLV